MGRIRKKAIVKYYYINFDYKAKVLDWNNDKVLCIRPVFEVSNALLPLQALKKKSKISQNNDLKRFYP